MSFEKTLDQPILIDKAQSNTEYVYNGIENASKSFYNKVLAYKQPVYAYLARSGYQPEVVLEVIGATVLILLILLWILRNYFTKRETMLVKHIVGPIKTTTYRADGTIIDYKEQSIEEVKEIEGAKKIIKGQTKIIKDQKKKIGRLERKVEKRDNIISKYVKKEKLMPQHKQ